MLNKILANEKPTLPEMPLAHITDWQKFLSIMEKGHLLASCSNENMQVCYFFYGSPYYKYTHTANKNDPRRISLGGMPMYRPVGLLFKAELVREAQSIYPFDSGAFELYKDHIPKDLTLDSFELREPESMHPGKIVNRYFGTNDNYLRGKVKPGFKAVHAIEQALFNLYSTKGIKLFDERNHGIEVQIGHNIAIDLNLELLILPESLCRHNSKMASKVPDNIKVKTYFDHVRHVLSEDCTKIQQIAETYVRRRSNRR